MRVARHIGRILILYFTMTVVIIGTMTALATRSLHRSALAQEFSQLETIARLAAHNLIDGADPEVTVERIAARSGARITLFDADGNPRLDSAQDVNRLGNQRDAPEVAPALEGRLAQSRRVTAQGHESLFVAIPVAAAPIAVVRLGRPTATVDAALAGPYRALRAFSTLFILLSAAAAYTVHRLITHPLHQLRRGAERFARGNFETPIALPPLEELGRVAEALNHMAGQLRDHHQPGDTHELEAVLASMVESVLAVDDHGRILKLNPAAAHLFKVAVNDAEGRILHEVIRNRDLHHFAARTLEQDGVIEGDIVLFDGAERYLQAHGAPLRNAAGSSIGGVIVLNDVTRLRRLENARSEFAANVSHELRTPITSIIGYVETLQDGALDSPEDAARFLAIIARQAQRLNALIEDLLALSRLERRTEAGGMDLVPESLQTVLNASLAECAGRAAACGIPLILEWDEDARAPMNAALFQQAIVNLIDNAIQHSDAGKPVRIRVHDDAKAIAVEVIDEGCGIAQEHQPRLFERFYRVDEDRNRQKGGTGLGLAIVKHVVRAHGGQITLDSQPGQGSTFRILLPRDTPPPDATPICLDAPPAAIIPPSGTDS